MRNTTRYIPKNAIPIDEPELGTVYVYPAGGGKYGAIAYVPKAFRKSWHYAFKTDAKLDKYIEDWFNGLRLHKKAVEERKAIDNAPHTLKVGDIITNSWGYDQTNVDWYRITRTTEHYVWLKPIAGHLMTGEGCAPMAGYESLALDENLKPIDGDGPETKHKASMDRVTMKHGSGSKWQGEKLYSSWYA